MYHRGAGDRSGQIMKDKFVLVTGSSSGIGRAITEHLLKAGATVFGIARNHTKFKPNTDKYKTFEIDVSDLKTLPGNLNEIIAENPCLNGLVSNAGYGIFGGLESFSAEQISSFIGANLTSHIVITRSVLPYFKLKDQSDIIFIGSEAAHKGGKKGSLYCAAKFGLRGFSQTIRDECADKNVRVSLINPGMVRTSFFEDLNFGPGDDPANAIEADDIALAAMSILSSRPGTVIDEINMTPLKKVIKFGIKNNPVKRKG